jgi:methionyl-tRNA synthetase
MKTVNLNTQEIFEAYGLKCQSLIPKALLDRPPFGSMKATVAPLQTSVRHNHHETELFFVIKGHGRVNSDQFEALVEKDSVVLLPAFSGHTITNLSAQEPLEFLTFWWEDSQAIDKALSTVNLQRNKDILVTATPPTPNGDLHLGHMSGPYLGADIYCRFMRYQGNRVHYLTGTDVNQTYVYTKAQQKDKDPKALAQFNTDAIKATLRSGVVNYDHFYNPYEMEGYNEEIQNFFFDLFNKQKLKAKTTVEYFDGDNYVHEAYIRGTCPHCGVSSDGNCCEKCGLPHDMPELISPTSFYKGALSKKNVKKLYFPLEPYREKLLSYFDELDLMAHHKLFIRQLFSKALPDIAVSHPTPWGIKHTVPGFEDQIIYVWAEMLPGYLTATQQSSGKHWAEFDSRVQFYGFDNTFYHLVLFPAMLMAAGREDALPSNFVINEFLHLDGSKFSTSREHLIWAKEFFGNHSPDLVRMYLARVRPEQAVNNFSVSGFDLFADHFVEQRLLFRINRFWVLLSETNNNEIPEAGAWNSATKLQYQILLNTYQTVLSAHQADSFSTHAIMSAVEQASEIMGSCCDMIEFLRQAQEERALMRTLLALSAMSLKVISVALIGIAPTFSARLMQELGMDATAGLDEQVKLFPGGQAVNPENKAYF